MKEKLKNFYHEIKMPFSWRRIWITVAAVLIIILIFFGGLSAYAYSYKDKVLPGVYLGDIPIGGMEREDLKSYLHKMGDKLNNEGLRFKYDINGKRDILIIYPVIVTEGDSVELIHVDVEKEAERLINYKKEGDWLSRPLAVLSTKTKKPKLQLKEIFVDEQRLLETLKEKLADYETEPKSASVEIESISPLEYSITSSSPGVVYRYDRALEQLRASWSKLRLQEIEIDRQAEKARILESDVEKVEDRLKQVLSADSLEIAYTDPHTRLDYSWRLTQNNIKDWLEVQLAEENGAAFGLNQELVLKFLEENIVPKVNVEARDAKFEVGENGKVVEFQGSRPGIKLDMEKTYRQINQAIQERTWHDEGLAKSVQLAVEKTEPNVKTGDVNDLGIKEILGIGISDYSGSPTNRIKNIRNAVNKLNGVLIKPGEEFSALKYTAPFTAAGGYLPELVIKGDEIKPEIGGGLCQIGTTLFRMAMNSAMEITQRRNHSLVVSYYNDPVNGLPGTDATVYEPQPDFRFKNDTSHHVLLQTYMDVNEQKLYFTLWGTNDGRQGYYSHPVLHRWIAYGEEKTIETADLEPGEEKCQHAFTGADASFVYTREMPDGEKQEITYESHYRPLPKICLIGVEEKSADCEEGEEDCEIVEEEENLEEEVDKEIE